METSHCIIVYKSLKSRQVNFQVIFRHQKDCFQSAQARVWTESGQTGSQKAGLHSGAEQRTLLARIFLSTSPAVRAIYWFVKTLLAL